MKETGLLNEIKVTDLYLSNQKGLCSNFRKTYTRNRE